MWKEDHFWVQAAPGRSQVRLSQVQTLFQAERQLSCMVRKTWKILFQAFIWITAEILASFHMSVKLFAILFGFGKTQGDRRQVTGCC